MSTYPLILNGLETQSVLVVGGGKIAEDKVVQLLEAGAGRVTVISPDLHGQLVRLFAEGRIRWTQRAYQPGDIAGDPPFLAIAATDDPSVNRAVADEARRARVLVNAVDDPPNCDFYAVSVVRQGGLTIGIGTNGQMPALAARLRRKFQRGFGPEYARLIDLAREMRPELARRFPDFETRRRVWYALADAPLIPMLRRGDAESDVREYAWRVVAAAENGNGMEGNERKAGSGDRKPQTGRNTPDDAARAARPGTVYLVGAGPGDPELITVKGLRLLRSADAVLYDRLAPAALLDEAPAHAQRIDVGKGPGFQRMAQEAIGQLLVELARAGKAVVRLKGGDPYVFGRGGEEALALAAAGVPFEVVPGISSAIAVPALAGIPVTFQHIGRSFTVITGQTRPAPEAQAALALDSAAGNGAQPPADPLEHWDWPALASVDTIVCLMGVANLPQITAGLLAAGRLPDTPVAIVEHGATPDQRVVAGPLDAIAAIARAEDVQPPAVIVVGNVVALHQALQPTSALRASEQSDAFPAT